MQIVALIGAFFKVVLFFGGLWKEKDEKKAQLKADLAKDVVDAFKESKKENRLSKLNITIGRINRMR